MLNQSDALRLNYSTPVDRIAARLLCKVPDFLKLPEKARKDLAISPPRIRPQDITFIFDAPPRPDHGDARAPRTTVENAVAFISSSATQVTPSPIKTEVICTAADSTSGPECIGL